MHSCGFARTPSVFDVIGLKMARNRQKAFVFCRGLTLPWSRRSSMEAAITIFPGMYVIIYSKDVLHEADAATGSGTDIHPHAWVISTLAPLEFAHLNSLGVLQGSRGPESRYADPLCGKAAVKVP